MPTPRLTLQPIGEIQADPAQNRFSIKLCPGYEEGLKGLQAFSHALVLWWSDGQATQGLPSHLTSHPPYPNAGAQGCFATRSPRRPNPIALTVVRLLAIDQENGTISLSSIDARDGSWVLDIKPYIPANERVLDAKTADWMADFPDHWQDPHPAKPN